MGFVIIEIAPACQAFAKNSRELAGPQLGAKAGGAKEARTPDLLNAIQALYQLSYDPIQSADNLNVPRRLSKVFPREPN